MFLWVFLRLKIFGKTTLFTQCILKQARDIVWFRNGYKITGCVVILTRLTDPILFIMYFVKNNNGL